MIRVLVAIALVLVSGCEVGRPIVGLRTDPPAREDGCRHTRCDDMGPRVSPRWEPGPSTGVASARCPDVRPALSVELSGPLALTRDLRCTDVELLAAGAFTLDLREALLEGARLHVVAADPGTVILGGGVIAIELSVEGPVDVRMLGGAIGASRIELRGQAPDRLGTLELDDVRVTESSIVAPHGSLRAHRSVLTRSILEAVEVSVALTSVFDVTLRAREIALLDAELRASDVEVGRLIAAAGRLEDVDVTRCGDVSLAVIDVIRSRIARCEAALRLEDAYLEASLVEAELVGRGQIRSSGLAGARVELEGGRISQTALCGVETFVVDGVLVECPSCDTPPGEVCGVSPIVEPYCPGFDLALCGGEPRPRTDAPGSAIAP